MIVCCFLLVFRLASYVGWWDSLWQGPSLTLFYISWVSRRIHRYKSTCQCTVSSVRGDILVPSSPPGTGPQYSLQSTHLGFLGPTWMTLVQGAAPWKPVGSLDPCFSGTCHTELSPSTREPRTQHVECCLGIRDPWLQTLFFLACDNSLARSHSLWAASVSSGQ